MIFCDALYGFLEGPLMQHTHYVAATYARKQQQYALRSDSTSSLFIFSSNTTNIFHVRRELLAILLVLKCQAERIKRYNIKMIKMY